MNCSAIACFVLLVVCVVASVTAAQQDQPRSPSEAAVDPKVVARTADRDSIAGQEVESTSFSVADGRLEMSAPGVWKKVEPAINMIEAEFSIDPVEGESKPGRLTVMGSGGSIDANIERWLGQVQQPDGGSSREKASITEKEIGGCKIHTLDVSGTYLDQRGPQAPKVELEDFRLLGVIIETGSVGNYFVKLYGPEKTIALHKDALMKMVEEIKIVE